MTRRIWLGALALCAIMIAGYWAMLERRGIDLPMAPSAEHIDHITVEKSARRLTLYRDGVALRQYPIDLGTHPVGAKQFEGDGKTPEGHFIIDRRNNRSSYHLSLGINYPRAEDTARAAQHGRSAGSDIFFHGVPNYLPAGGRMLRDWTAGCIAMSNDAIRDLWRVTPVGTTVEIRP